MLFTRAIDVLSVDPWNVALERSVLSLLLVIPSLVGGDWYDALAKYWSGAARP
ncbi:MAG: hypothetical protein M3N19_12585 [Candidatus Eremiobacteraeota bacterium]|nr:hypothetical protein [Candidatus Eremiobacteraeota bacterium]